MDKKSQECKIKYVDLEPEYKIKYGSMQVNKKGKVIWNRPKGKAEKEKASQEYVDR